MKLLRGLRPKLTGAWYRFRGFGSNGRHLDVFEDDLWLVGYPKSGNTWLDFLVASLRTDHCEDVDFLSVEKLVSDIYYNNARQLKQLTRPRYLKSHEPYDPRYGKVVYIVRDPRDVVVSYYYHHLSLQMLDPQFPLSEFVDRFVSGSIDNLGEWGEHVGGWLEHCKDADFLMIRYEDMKRDACKVLKTIALFFEIEVTDNRLAETVKWCSAENMRRLEFQQKDTHPAMKYTRKDIPFVRKTVSGGWKQELTDRDVQSIIQRWGDVMSESGYES